MSPDEILQGKDFAQMSAAEIAQAKALIARFVLPEDRTPSRRFAPDGRGARIDPRRSFRRSLRGGGAIDLTFRRRSNASADRRPLRHFRLDGRVHQAVPAFPARGGRKPSRDDFPVRHATDECDAFAGLARSGRSARARRGSGRRLVRRHADRRFAAPVQPRLVTPGAGAGRDRAAVHRRARARRRRGAGARDGASAQIESPADLGQSAAPFR